MWSCPHCRQALSTASQTSLVCPEGHSFDLAREGYVNLLPPNRKRSLDPGDNKLMIAARRRVHDAGLYQVLATGIQAEVRKHSDEVSTVLDLGCGEGYYSAAIIEALPRACLFAVDIAKPAVRLAAKRCSGGHFAVASAFDVPLADAGMDLILSVFAPVSEHELQRLLRPGGYYLKVIPAPAHLWELRCLLYDNPQAHQAEPLSLEFFEPVNTFHVEYQLKLAGELLQDLVSMTPYAYRGQRENREKLLQLEELELQMAFTVSLQRFCPA